MSVLTWHHGYTVPSAEVKAFLAEGYTGDQYELLVDSISAGLTSPEARDGIGAFLDKRKPGWFR